MGITMQVRSNRLGSIGASLRREAGESVSRAVLVGVDSAQRHAPVDTGNLKNSIQGESSGLSGQYGTGVEYGPYQEFGTRYISGQPYMGPSALDARKALESDLNRLEGRLG